MTDAKQPEEPKALFTVDLTPDGATETAGQTFGRIIGGVGLMILGAVIGLGAVLLFILAFIIPAINDWFDIIDEFWWIAGAIGLGIAVLGFELVRRGRKRNRSAVANTFDTLAASGIIDADTETTSTGFDGTTFGKDDNPNRTPPPTTIA